MSSLVLVRHGQASFLADDYDQLSELGVTQARRLGEFWKRTGTHFNAIYRGPARRHAQTAGIVRGAAGPGWPEAARLAEFDEYDGFKLLKAVLPSLVRTDPMARELEAAHRAWMGASEPARTFDRLFQHVTRRWAAGEIEAEGVEPWPEFCARVERGIERVVQGAPPGSRIVVFTSGGPIAVAARRALDLTAVKTLELSWASCNASYSEFLFSSSRFSLARFNAHPHLEGDGLLSWR